MVGCFTDGTLSTFFGVLFVLLASALGQSFERGRSVWVEQGLIRGKIYRIEGRLVQIFRGVPYAEAPVGPLRFKRSVKKERWDGEFSATEYGPPCIQFMDFHKHDRYSRENMARESEDCLSLNIFSPYDLENEGLIHPILVWIHGGSFLAGSADTGIDMEIMARNIVFRNVTFVSINYRLGPLGFMSISYGDGRIEGNFGLWDQKLALEWIQRNIKQFNGDPTRVTVMGESAGSAAVSALALSPLTSGLITRAIAMSGSATSGWATHRHPGPPQWEMANVAEYIRCNRVIPDEDLGEVLSREPPSEKGRLHEHCNLQETLPDCLIIADGELVVETGPEAVTRGARVALMTGVAQREWAHKKPEFYQFYRFGRLTRHQVEDSVRKIVESAYIADIEFVSPCQTEVDAYAGNGVNVFAYSFKRGLDYPLFGDYPVTVFRHEKSAIGRQLSAFHGLDHAYIFTEGYTSNFVVQPWTRRDRAMSRLLTKLITNFVATGNPSTENFTWPVYTNESANYVALDLPPRAIKGPLHFPMPAFWNEEVDMLSRYTLGDKTVIEQASSSLSYEERIQLDAYRRAWYAMWAFLIGTALLIWILLICIVWHKIRLPATKPYDNIAVNTSSRL